MSSHEVNKDVVPCVANTTAMTMPKTAPAEGLIAITINNQLTIEKPTCYLSFSW